jgi:hypothetical protein
MATFLRHLYITLWPRNCKLQTRGEDQLSSLDIQVPYHHQATCRNLDLHYRSGERKTITTCEKVCNCKEFKLLTSQCGDPSTNLAQSG